MFFRKSRHTSNDNTNDSLQGSYLGQDAVIEGSLTSEGEIALDGLVRGNINAKRCIIEPSGAVEGEIVADEVIVRGKVTGPIRAYHVHLQRGSEVDGDIVHETVSIENGALFNGAMWRSADPLQQALPDRGRKPLSGGPFLGSPAWDRPKDDDLWPIKTVKPGT